MALPLQPAQRVPEIACTVSKRNATSDIHHSDVVDLPRPDIQPHAEPPLE
jgi:hypothetical protein